MQQLQGCPAEAVGRAVWRGPGQSLGFNTIVITQKALQGAEEGCDGQGVFDLGLGNALGHLGKEIEADVMRILLKRPEEPSAVREGPSPGSGDRSEASRQDR